MKIYAVNRDEILRRKKEYESEEAKYNDEYNQYLGAKRTFYRNIESSVKDAIGDTSIPLNVHAGKRYDSVSVEIDNGSTPHSDSALTWNWNVQLSDEGEVIKETGSWSGLSATTPENIANLKESVRILEVLNNLDWKQLLSAIPPAYEEYVTTRPGPKPNFEKELLYADIADAMHDEKLIKGHGYKYYRSGVSVYYRIISLAPQSYKVQEIYEDYLSDPDRWPDPYRIQKDKFLEVINIPLQIVEV